MTTISTTAPDFRLTQADFKNVDLFWLASCVVEMAYAATGYFPKNKALKKLCGLSIFFKSVINACIKRSTTVVAICGKEVVGTLAVYTHSWKLPVHDLFPNEINDLLRKGAKLGYAGSFATSEKFRGKASLASLLFKEAMDMFKAGHITHVICVVNPCHIKMYNRLGFMEVSRKENMPGLDNAPAVLLVLQLETLNERLFHRIAKH